MARRKKRRIQKQRERERDEARPPGKQAMATHEVVADGSGERLPPGRSARPVREALVRQVQQQLGNRGVQRRLAVGQGGHAPAGLLQRENGDQTEDVEAEAGPATHPGGAGPGQVTGARETFYDVSGTNLHEVSPQLNHFDGFAAETNADFGMNGRVRPERVDGELRAEIDWAVSNVTVGLPRWAGYDEACPAAQQEWDRFMGQTRIHEQSAHVDAAGEFLEGLGAEDKMVTGADADEFRENLTAKRDELAGRLQAIHDACDHGAAIDAILHPDNGNCPEETEGTASEETAFDEAEVEETEE